MRAEPRCGQQYHSASARNQRPPAQARSPLFKKNSGPRSSKGLVDGIERALAGFAIFFLGGLIVLAEVAVPFIHLAQGFVFFNAVALLNSAYELVLLAADQVEIVIRQLSPAGANVAFHLFPLAFDLVPIHGSS